MNAQEQKGDDPELPEVDASKMPSPSSVEEAAALLGASITKVNDVHVYRTTAPPKGLHSSFSTVKPVPCSELYVRLASLTNILQNHLDSAEGSGDDLTQDITLEAAPSIISLLHKLFNISSSLALAPILLHSSSNTIPPANPLQAIAGTASPTPSTIAPKKKRGANQQPPPSPRSKNLQVPPVRIIPPLCSQPIRKLWVQCLTLAHRLSPAHALPSTNPHVLLAPYFQTASNHPRSAKSAGGTRVAGLAILSSIFQDDVLGARYVRPLLAESITLCLNGLKSSGAGDVVHRIHSVQCALSAVMAWRDMSSPIIKKNVESRVFISANTIEDRVLAECVRLVKKGADDKYPEVRLAAAEFASVLSSVLITEEPRLSEKKYNVLMYMDEVMAACLRNLDDASVGASVAWSEALARCICTAVEYHSKNDKVHVVDASGSGGSSSGNKNDFTSKIKAFQEARRAIGTIGSVSCTNLDSVINFLVHQFTKVKGEGATRMGGSHSMGGRNAQIGITQTITNLCKFQLETGGIGSSAVQDCMAPSDALKIIMKMVGSHLEQDDENNDGSMIAPSLSDLDDSIMFDATTSPKRKNLSKTSGVGGFLRNMSANINESSQKRPSDASLARMGTIRVLRKGLSGIMPEAMQLIIFRELATLSKPREDYDGAPVFNRHQLQVALVEISNLAITLGEACASCLGELIPALQYCLSDADHGVRHEAAVAFQALAVAFPSAGRKYIMAMVGEIQVHQDEVLALGTKSSNASNRAVTPPPTPQKRRNRRRQEHLDETLAPNSNIGKSLDHQYSIHGNALVLSMILHVMPQLPGGLPAELLDIIIAVADNLISCQGNANLLRNNPGAVVTCVRAGYNIISGALTMGAKATIPHLQKIFGIWMRSATLMDDESNRLEPIQSVSCVEPFITSITVFLQKNSELLLNVPDALNRTIQILEKVFPIILGYSQLEDCGSRIFASTRLDSAKAAIMEAFAWLPSGSYPTITNSIFTFASRQIQVETKNGYTCSLLDTIISKEDDVLDIRSPTRTERYGQTDCGIVEEHVVALASKCIGLSEREAVLHLLVEKNRGTNQPDDTMPTPLHEVGTWTKPPLPSRLSKERLLNSAIHMFAATFGLQDGHQQMSAVKMLDELLAYFLGKRQEKKCAKNITAALLSCVKVLSSSDVPNGSLVETSSNWMTQAATVLVGILPIPQNHARRAAAEGLGLLSALDSSGGSRKLQSSILRALERLMVIEVTDISAQQKPQTPTPTSSSAGCLLTFACIQRYALEKSPDPEEIRQMTNQSAGDNGTKFGGTIPTMIMMTRLMPYISTQDADDDSYISRTYALHSFFLLLSYSKIIESASVSMLERIHILSKAVEVVESNFYAAWTTNETEVDIKSLEIEKASFEPAYFAVMIRLMTYLVPRLSLLQRDGGSAASRFSSMVTLIVKSSRFHSLVVSESLIFFESLSAHQRLLPAHNLSVTGTGNPCMDIFSMVTSIFQGQKLATLYTISSSLTSGCEGSTTCLRSAVASIFSFIAMPDGSMFDNITNSNIISHLFALFERILTSREYCCAQYFRSIASPHHLERSRKDSKSLLHEVHYALEALLHRELEWCTNYPNQVIKWLLLSKAMINGDTGHEHASKIFLLAGPPRWQHRHEIIHLASVVLDSFAISLTKVEKTLSNSSLFTIVPHVGALIGTSCTVAMATSDESELLAYQKAGLQMLNSLIRDFSGLPDPTDADAKLLDEYVSQIIPSIKQALAYDIDDAEDSIDTEGSRELFFMGCECLQQLAKKRLIPDTHALKRLIKTILPSKDLLAFSSYPKDADDDLHALHVKPTSFVDNRTSILLPRVASIWTIADIYLSGELGLLQSEHFDAIKSELSSYEDVLAINSSALSIDSCRFKATSEKFADEEKSEARPFGLKSGLTFLNSQDVDNATKFVMERSCSSMACFGLDIILNLLESESEDSAKFQDLISWTGRLLDVILTEFYGCMEEIHALNEDEVLSNSTSEKCITCLFVLCKAVESSTNILSLEEIRNVLSCAFNIIKFTDVTSGINESPSPAEIDPSEVHPMGHLPSNVVIRACSFVEAVCKSDKKNEVGKDLLIGVLTPLLAIEEMNDALQINEESNATIMISILRSVQLVLKDIDDNVDVIKSLLQFSLQMLEVTNKSNNTCLKASFHELILFCMSGSAITDKERLQYIKKMAENGCWDAWQQCVDKDPATIQTSLRFVQDALSDHANQTRHIDALSAVVNIAKCHTDLIAPLLGSVGAMVLEIFQLYGTHQLHGTRRTIACATCMKIVMFTFSYITSEKVDNTHGAAFLSIVFQVLVELVSYNGLPNERKKNPGSDPALGRMSAQFFVHVLRTSPALFKECMGDLDDSIRSVLESSVRADMSGYASAAPLKKKLNLRSFKK